MERNYSKIPNELLEGLAKIRLSNYELRVLWVVMRKTFGWNKLSDRIALSQFIKETGVRKQHVCRATKSLVERKVITKRGNAMNPIISINTNWGEWEALPKKVIVTNRGVNVTNSGEIVTNLGTYKEHYPKNTIQRKDNLLSYKELIKLYEQGNRDYKPFFRGKEMRLSQGKWFVIEEGGEWKDFNVDCFKEVEWRPKL